jgi:hypothetical protein
MTSSPPVETFRYARARFTRLVWIIALVALLVAVNSAAAFEAEYGAYRQAVSRVCTTKVTPELVQRYQAVLAAIERAKASGRAPANLAGPRPPEMAYLDCFQTR